MIKMESQFDLDIHITLSLDLNHIKISCIWLFLPLYKAQVVLIYREETCSVYFTSIRLPSGYIFKSLSSSITVERKKLVNLGSGCSSFWFFCSGYIDHFNCQEMLRDMNSLTFNNCPSIFSVQVGTLPLFKSNVFSSSGL